MPTCAWFVDASLFPPDLYVQSLLSSDPEERFFERVRGPGWPGRRWPDICCHAQDELADDVKQKMIA
jgi:hypothetical protein